MQPAWNKRDTGEGLHGAARHSYAHAQYLYTQPVYTVHCCVYGRSLALAVQCETTHSVYEFRRGFCTLVLSYTPVIIHLHSKCTYHDEGYIDNVKLST